MRHMFRLDKLLAVVFAHFYKNTIYNHIPILMYHSITEKIKTSRHPYFCTDISKEKFESHLKILANLGYSAISLDTLPDLFNNRESIDRKVVITFDDGYSNFFEYALPLLLKYSSTATVFIPTSLIGNSTPIIFKNKPLMTRDQIIECDRNGISIGSHSKTHGFLIKLNSKELHNELHESKKMVEELLSKDCNTFAYPFKYPEENNAFVKTFKNEISKCGYKLGVSTRIGRTSPNDQLYYMKRIPVNEYDDDGLFKAKLFGGYDWLYHLQRYSKQINSIINRKICHK